MNNILVNVYGKESLFESNKLKYDIVSPLYYTANKLEKHVNLLLFTKDCNNRN